MSRKLKILPEVEMQLIAIQRKILTLRTFKYEHFKFQHKLLVKIEVNLISNNIPKLYKITVYFL